jgi:hypothetical protein
MKCVCGCGVVWCGVQEMEAKEAARQEALHSRRELTISVDIAGRRVVVENDGPDPMLVGGPGCVSVLWRMYQFSREALRVVTLMQSAG